MGKFLANLIINRHYLEFVNFQKNNMAHQNKMSFIPEAFGFT